MKKSYWKECFLLLLGIVLGSLYQTHLGNVPAKETAVVQTDTIRDTVYAKLEIPPLCAESVMNELLKQEVPFPHIVLAQSMLETGHYTSRLSKTHNNIFGMKKGNSYRKYDNYIECITDYKKRISSRYKGGDYYAFLEKIGYAENSEYTTLLKGVVRRNLKIKS